MLGFLSMFALAFFILAATSLAQVVDQFKNTNPASQPPNAFVGNQACARCHASIYESYSRTPMAHASGAAIDNLVPAEFTHEKSGVHYRIYSEGNTAWLGFERPGDPSISGKHQLLYFIGSGRRGRSYLFAVDDFVFESPVNWYADGHRWDMAPAYGNVREIPLNLPAYPECLRCHTSGMQLPINGSQNEYPTPLFTQDGVGCERCHGPGAAHIKGAAIVNPVKLTAERRDSVCMQCHLEASVAIERAGHHASDFRPGAVLDDYIRHYVLSANQSSGLGANSQFEALAQSQCKKKSGDSMSCMSCHDPHSYPAADERASYYRRKCLACHGAAFGAKHHPEKPDCTACHMPASLSTDIAHTEVTDHRIQRRPELSPQLLQDSVAPSFPRALLPFPDSKAAADDIRDLALAWQSVAGSGGAPDAAAQADKLLQQTVKQSPDDPTVLSGFAYAELQHDAPDRARKLYKKALALNPNLIDAAANLGVIEARSGNLSAAVRLWQAAFDRAPGDSSIGMNLARSFCEAGRMKDARTSVSRVLKFNPDLTEARKLLQHLDADPPSCGR